ncbi:Cytochrome P450 6a2 [Gryllus bimaculatus]|nr:Cytochrome P450 6a2 [Gryllus bimaculatus]
MVTGGQSPPTPRTRNTRSITRGVRLRSCGESHRKSGESTFERGACLREDLLRKQLGARPPDLSGARPVLKMLQVLAVLFVLWVLAALLTAVARRSAATRRHWLDQGVAHEPPHLLFGSLCDVLLFRITMDEWLRALYERFPGERLVGFWQMRSPALLVRDPALARAVLMGDFASFPGRGVKVDESDPSVVHLINIQGPRWRCLRTRLSPFTSSGRLRAMVPTLRRVASHASRHISATAERPTDTGEVMTRYTTDVIGTCVYGLQLAALGDPASRFHALGRRVTGISVGMALRRALRLLAPRVARLFSVRQFPPQLTAFFCGAVVAELDRREREERDGPPRADFMQLLLEIRKDMRKAKVARKEGEIQDDAKSKKPKNGDFMIQDVDIPDSILAAQAFVFFLAGFDSPSSTATFCLYELAKRPDLQRKARDDIRRGVRAAREAAGGDGDGDGGGDDDLTYDALQEMTYIDMVMAETLRMYPVTGQLFRECTKKYRFPDSDVELQAGTMVFVSIFAMHHDPLYFPEPELFRPERFSPGEKGLIKPYTYMPFGAGPRFCIGERFALLQMKMVLARILLDFEVQTCAETPRALQFDPRAFGLRLSQPVWLRFMLRLQLVLFALWALAALLTWVLRRTGATLRHWRERGVAHEAPSLLFGSVGDVLLFRTTMDEWLRALYERFPDERLVGFWRMRSPALLVRDPALARAVLAGDVASFPGRGIKVDEYTTDVIGTCVYGLQLAALGDPASRFHALGRRVTGISVGMALRRALRLLAPRVARLFSVRQFPPQLTAFFCGAVVAELDRREREERDGPPRADFMQLLLEIRKDMRNAKIAREQDDVRKQVTKSKNLNKSDIILQDIDISDATLAAQAFVFFLAGFDSPSSTATFCLYELAKRPDLQRKARDDIRRGVRAAREAAGGDGDGDGGGDDDLTYDALQEMTYIDMKYRFPDSDVELQAGTMVFVSIFAMHHDPLYFPEPELFRPERFSPAEKGLIKPYTYMPFGAGPRFCIGERFALLQMKMVLARILLDFEVQTCAETPRALQFDPRAFGLRLSQPVWLRFVPLRPSAHCAT